MARITSMGQAKVYDPSRTNAGPLLGIVAFDGPDDELRDTRYIVIEGADGKSWQVEIGPQGSGALPPRGAIVEIAPRKYDPRPADRAIAEVASSHGGQYSTDAHRLEDPDARPAFLEAHKRRLEAMRRAGFIERTSSGVFLIPDDYLDRAAQYGKLRGGQVQMTVKSWLPLEQQVNHHGPAWLDDIEHPPSVETKFGRTVRDASRKRIAYLDAQGWLQSDGELNPAVTATLAAEEIAAAAKRLSAGRSYVDLAERGRFDGAYERPVNLGQGRFALIANAKEFTLVPWRAELEQQHGRSMTIRNMANGIEWAPGKLRGIGR